MARRLTLVRHAKSSWDDPSFSDHQRPLNNRGLRDAPVMGTRFASRRPIATRIISSDAERARSTARFIAQELGYDPEVVITDSRLYLASPQRILDVLAATCAEQDNLMVIGHNPGMTELANQVTDISIDNMPTCAALCLETDVNDWRELASRPGTLVWYDYPKKPPGQ